jgi:hypothetical protein
VLIDDGRELDVGVPERDDAVRRAPGGMSSALERAQTVVAFQTLGRLGEVVDGNEDVVELQACEAAPAPTASSDAWKSVLSILPW